MNDIAEAAQPHKDWLMLAVDADTEAFNAVIDARRLPKKTDEEIAARDEAIKLANRGATMVPLEVLERNVPVLDLTAKVASKGNPNSLSDAGVAALCCMTCAEGAYYNVLINLAGTGRGCQMGGRDQGPRGEGAGHGDEEGAGHTDGCSQAPGRGALDERARAWNS